MIRLLMVILIPVLLSGCGTSAPRMSDPPPVDESEGVVEADGGRVAVELAVEPDQLDPDGRVVLRVVNHGEQPLSYGRPITAERWHEDRWEETAESRETAWTMELLMLDPGKTGVEQAWPFFKDQRPEPGWYRFTKLIQSADSGDMIRLTVRARVLVKN
jgi:hypothetical protein